MRAWVETLRSPRCVAVVLMGMIACGGGGGAGEARAPAETTPPPIEYAAPQMSVVYPPPVSTALEPSMTVRGTATNAAQVSVNGVPARLLGNTWSVTVPVPMGTSDLDVVVKGLDGSTIDDQCVVSYNGPHFQTPYDLVYDAARDRLIVADEHRRSLFTVDIASGERRLLFESPDAPEPTHKFRLLKPLEMDAARNAVLVLREDGLIDSVDLDTGEATRIVDGTEDYVIVQPRAIALDPATRNLYVADRNYCTLHRINLDTREHRIASDFSSGGTDLHFRDIYWDSNRNDVVIAGTGRAGGAVIRVHMHNGYRSDLGLGMAKPDAMSYDPIADVAFIIDEPSVRLYERATRSVSSRFQPAAADFARFASVACKPGTTIAYLVDDANDSIVAFDRADGSFTRISGDRIGDGPAMGAREGDGILEMTGDPARERTLVAVEYRERYKFVYPTWYYDTQYAVLAIDAKTGDRTVLAADAGVLGKKSVVGARGSGPLLGRPVALAIDSVADRVLVLDGGSSGLIALDPVAGDRTLIARGDGTTGVWQGMVVEPERRRALIRTDAQELLAVHLDTGEATILPQTLPADVGEMAKLPGSSSLVLSSSSTARIQVVDVETGAFSTAWSNETAPVIRDLHPDPASGRIVALSATEIFTLDPVMGTLHPLAAAGNDGFFPIEPERVCIDSASGCLQVITSGTRSDLRGVFAIDPTNGSVVLASKE